MTKTYTLTLRGGELARVDRADQLRLRHYEYRRSGDDVIRSLTVQDEQGRMFAHLKHDVLGRYDAAVRHVDGDSLNNTFVNLEVIRSPETSHLQRFAQVATPKSTQRPHYGGAVKFHSEVGGVTYRKDRASTKPWRVRVQVGGKAYYLGHYASREEAEQVANDAYARLYGAVE